MPVGLSLAAGVLSPASCFSAAKGDGAPQLLRGVGMHCPWAPGAAPWEGVWKMLHPRPLVSIVVCLRRRRGPFGWVSGGAL